MSATVDRAFAAAAEYGYSGPQSRALLRMALDADHDSGENCVTGRERVHEAAGYADDGGRCRAATRTIKRFTADGVVRCDLEVAGIGRLFTVCPVAEWSGTVSARSTAGRKLAAWLARNQTRDTQVSRVPADPGHPGVPGEQTFARDIHPGEHTFARDTTRDTQVSPDHRTTTTTDQRPFSSAVADEANHLEVDLAETARPDLALNAAVVRLCDLLADLIRQRDPKAKVAPASNRWRDACRLLLDADGRSVAEVERVLRWSQADQFWHRNILSMPKLREKFMQLLANANAAGNGRRSGPTAADFFAIAKGDAA